MKRIAFVRGLAGRTERQWCGEDECDGEEETKCEQGFPYFRSGEARTEIQ